MNTRTAATSVMAAALLLASCSQTPPPAPPAPDTKPQANQNPTGTPAPNATDPMPQPKVEKPAAIPAMSEEELAKLLQVRVNGGLGLTFGEFSRLFLVNSRLQIGKGIGLMTGDRKI